tara:strand:+ start:353 stop:1192 length:840 start_codon:yes stop_codon:yes gene_type:complete
MDMYGISAEKLHENDLHTQSQVSAQNRLNAWQNKVTSFKQAKSALTSKDTTKDVGVDTPEGLTNITRGLTVGRAGLAYGKGIVAGAPWSSTGATVGTSHSLGVANLRAMPEVEKAGQGIEGTLTGTEGIAQKALSIGGAGAKSAFVGAKVIGNVGAALDVGKGVDNLIQTGNVFKDADTGKEESKTDIAGDLLTVGGGILDVASAFTGGLLVPFAMAVNVAGAGTSLAGSIKDEVNAKNALARTKPRDTPPSGAIAPEYETLGFIGNMSHDPTTQISSH